MESSACELIDGRSMAVMARGRFAAIAKPMPPALLSLVTFLESLSERERREALMDMAEQAPRYAPREGERFDLEDVRRDTECSDAVGVHVRRLDAGRVEFAISLGCEVQTLTRALTVALCRTLQGEAAEVILALSPEVIPRLVGAQLVALRSRTIYYVLGRLKAAVYALSGASDVSAG